MDRQAEVDKNFEAFQTLLPELLKEQAGRYALMRHQKLVACFDTAKDAMTAGQTMFEDDIFSIQQITEATVDLGFFSRAVH